MRNESVLRPGITIDFKKDRIRIYKRTLRIIGDPEYILLLVNPEDCTLAIMRSDRYDLRAYRLPRVRFGDKQSFEITSKSLMQNLLSMCDKWQANHLYRIYGELIKNEGVVQFNLTESFLACGTRG